MMSQYFLKPDALTNGVITKILEDNWRSEITITKKDLKNIHHTLIKYGVFGEVAESIVVPLEKEKIALGEKLLLQLKDAKSEDAIMDYLLNKWDELILNN